MYIRVNKNAAKRLVNEGYTIRVLPCKMRLANVWVDPYEINKAYLEERETTFDKFCNSYSYYNCNNELGRYIAFYLYGDFTMGVVYKMSKYKDAVKLYKQCYKESMEF